MLIEGDLADCSDATAAVHVDTESSRPTKDNSDQDVKMESSPCSKKESNNSISSKDKDRFSENDDEQIPCSACHLNQLKRRPRKVSTDSAYSDISSSSESFNKSKLGSPSRIGRLMPTWFLDFLDEPEYTMDAKDKRRKDQ